MTLRRGLSVKRVVILAGTLLALTVWQVHDAKVASAQPIPVAFKCYEATPGGNPLNEDVTLPGAMVDGFQFPEENVTVRATKYFCTPTCEMGGELCASTVLKCYNITAAGPPVNQQFNVTTSVGTDGDRETLTVRTAQLYCVVVSSVEASH